MKLLIANKNYSSWSLRPWLLMKVLQIPFTEEQKWFQTSAQEPQFHYCSKTGLLPVLHSNNIEIWDSLAITEYLAELYIDVWPHSFFARSWSRSAIAEMHSGFIGLRQYCPMNCSIEVKLHSIPEYLKRDILRLEILWEEGLTLFRGPYLAGDEFTAVDAFFAPVVSRIKTYGLSLNPICMQYVDLIYNMPQFQEWRTGANSEEPEEAHELECIKNGIKIYDCRN